MAIKDQQRGWPFRMAVLLIALLTLLILGEITVRLFTLVPPTGPTAGVAGTTLYRRSKNPILSVELVPGATTENTETKDPVVTVINMHGMRDKPRKVGRTEGKRRLLLLGDEIVEGPDMRRSLTIAGQWEALADKMEVLNFGVSGYNAGATVELLATKAVKFRPDTVVLLLSADDFDNFVSENHALGPVTHRPGWLRLLFRSSRLFQAVALRTDLFAYATDAAPLYRNRRAMGDNNVTDALRHLRDLAAEFDFEPIVAVWPRFENDGMITDGPTMPGSDALVVERLASMVDVHVARLSPFFATHRSKFDIASVRSTYTTGDGKTPSADGATVAAEALNHLVRARLTAMPEGPRWTTAPGRDEAAIKAANALGTATPHYARVYLEMGRALLRHGQLQAAHRQLTSAIGQDPQFAEAWCVRGDARRRLGVGDPALSDFNQALLLDPGLTEAYIGRGKLYLITRRHDQALKDFSTAIEINPQLSTAFNGRATAYQHLNRPEVALIDYSVALSLSPDSVEVLNNRGQLQGQMGRFHPALDDLSRAVNLKPEFAEAFINRALVHHAMTRFDLALSDLTQACELRPSDGRFQTTMAWFLATNPDGAFRNGDMALAAAQRALMLPGGDHFGTLEALAAAHAEQGTFEKAISRQNEAIAAAPAALKSALLDRLRLYESGKPYHQPFPASTSAP